jgi:hypothetical protein
VIAVLALGPALEGLAIVALAAILALAFVRTAWWALALVAAGAAAASAGFENELLPVIVVGGVVAGIATGFSPEWWRRERLSAERHRDVLPASHRELLASASRWYPGRIAATSLVLTFPAAVVVVCLVLARWSLDRAP